MIHVAAVRHSSLLTDEAVDAICKALTYQGTHHIASAWGLASVHVERRTPGGADWQLLFFDNTDQAGALGYHDDSTPGGLPALKIFVKTCRADGVSESSCASHELAEALVDPFLGTANFDGSTKFWATEIGDPVQAESYPCEGIEVSNFVFPSWFNPDGKGRFDHLAKAQAPFEITSGGYSQFLDITHPSQGWQQVGAELGAGHTRPGRRRGDRD